MMEADRAKVIPGSARPRVWRLCRADGAGGRSPLPPEMVLFEARLIQLALAEAVDVVVAVRGGVPADARVDVMVVKV